jgi:hypothetical protein
MTLETAKAILSTSRMPMLRGAAPDHTEIERLAFETRVTRLRPRKYLRLMVTPPSR